MSQNFDLKQIERKAFRSNYEDGLWDIYIGLVVVFMAIFMYRPVQGYSALNIIIFSAGYGLAYLVYRAGKKYIPSPAKDRSSLGPCARGASRPRRLPWESSYLFRWDWCY